MLQRFYYTSELMATILPALGAYQDQQQKYSLQRWNQCKHQRTQETSRHTIKVEKASIPVFTDLNHLKGRLGRLQYFFSMCVSQLFPGWKQLHSAVTKFSLTMKNVLKIPIPIEN